MNIKISIIMTVFNGDKYIKQSLDSLVNQTFQDWELILIENCSTDDTKKIINQYKDKRIKKIFFSKKKLRTHALNFGVEKSSSEYIGILDADDVAINLWLEESIRFLDKNKDISVVGGWAYLIDEKGNKFATLEAPSYPKIINQLFSFTFPIVHSSIVYRTKILKSFNGPYDESIDLGHDWDLLIRISKFDKIVILDSFWVMWRRYSQSLTAKTENSIKSRFDKLNNYKKSIDCTNNWFYLFKNNNRQSAELFALSFLYLQNKNFSKSLRFFLIGFFRNPFAIIINNKVLRLFVRFPVFQKEFKNK